MQSTTIKINEMVVSFEELRDKHDDPASQNLNNAIRGAAEVREALFKQQNTFEQARETLGKDRLPISLERFDKAFGGHAISQNLRWLMLDFGFPFLLGVGSAVLTLVSLYPALKFWV